jgi:hypothetical protein
MKMLSTEKADLNSKVLRDTDGGSIIALCAPATLEAES